MKKYLIVILFFSFFAMAFKSNSGGLKVGTIAPEFVMKDIQGKEVKLSDYKGKLVLIDGAGFEIISISLDDNLNDWKEAVTLDGYTWANLSEGKKWDADIAKLYQVTSLPTNYLIDKNGKIIEKDLRGNMLDNILMSLKK